MKKGFKKLIMPCWVHVPFKDKDYPFHITVEYEIKNAGNGRLSMSGVVGADRKGDCAGSAGQCEEAFDRLTIVNEEEGWTLEKISRLREIWGRWHLNDMFPGCPHLMPEADKRVEYKEYHYGDRHSYFEDYILEGCCKDYEEYEICAREYKWIDDAVLNRLSAERQAELKDVLADFEERMLLESKTVAGRAGSLDIKQGGLIGKKCDKCGLVFGHAWYSQAVPEDVLKFLSALKDTKVPYHWSRG